jgi:hypothetical protein
MTTIEQTSLWKRNYDLIHIASVNDVKGSIFLNIGYSFSIDHYFCFESKLFSLVMMTDNSNLRLFRTCNFIRFKHLATDGSGPNDRKKEGAVVGSKGCKVNC